MYPGLARRSKSKIDTYPAESRQPQDAAQNQSRMTMLNFSEHHKFSACSLVGFWADLGWLMLVYCERKTLLAG